MTKSLQEAIAATMTPNKQSIKEASGSMDDGSYFLSMIEEVKNGEHAWLETRGEVMGAIKVLKELHRRQAR